MADNMKEITTSWHSYPKIFHIGHGAIANIFDGDWICQEKIDGSQVSFGIFDGELRARSKSAQLVLDAPDKMFKLAVDIITSKKHLLHDGWTYRGEYLQRPKHNTLAYSRCPINNIIIFDINTGHEKYLSYRSVAVEASRLGFETVPLIDLDPSSVESFKRCLDNVSVLGGQKLEGIVVKNYQQFNGMGMGQVSMGKYVSEEFKEIHSASWKQENPDHKNIILQLSDMLRTPARWNKAVQHLAEEGRLERSAKDIGALMKEVTRDSENECRDLIVDKLWGWAWPQISRSITGGLPQWYKDKLLEEAVEWRQG